MMAFLDISGASADISGSQAYFYLWNTNEAVNEELAILPVLQYNVRHDGVYVDTDILNANFIANPIELCEQEETQFTDQSTGDVISWEWSFPGGYPDGSVEQNPIIWYGKKENMMLHLQFPMVTIPTQQLKPIILKLSLILLSQINLKGQLKF